MKITTDNYIKIIDHKSLPLDYKKFIGKVFKPTYVSKNGCYCHVDRKDEETLKFLEGEWVHVSGMERSCYEKIKDEKDEQFAVQEVDIYGIYK